MTFFYCFMLFLVLQRTIILITADGFQNKSLNKFTFEQLKSYFADTIILKSKKINWENI
jgi:hypothetical protein